jgi:hypothetical protein
MKTETQDASKRLDPRFCGMRLTDFYKRFNYTLRDGFNVKRESGRNAKPLPIPSIHQPSNSPYICKPYMQLFLGKRFDNKIADINICKSVEDVCELCRGPR